MNEATRQVYDFIFKSQFDEGKVLTEELIEQLIREKTMFGNKLEVGQQLNYILIASQNGNEGIGLSTDTFMYPKELEYLEIFYSYKYNAGKNGGIPVFEPSTMKIK